MGPSESSNHVILRTDTKNSDSNTLICFSHLRWDFVFQRPQHLMSRFAVDHDVLYWEEPVYSEDLAAPSLHVRQCSRTSVTVATPQLVASDDRSSDETVLQTLLDQLLAGRAGRVIRWYYTPMMLPFSAHVPAACIVYDCMDELANFKNAPAALVALERDLFDVADIVFTGGHSLYEAKRHLHANIHPFPSGVDAAHFAQARTPGVDPADQRALPHPRLGYYGVIDERMDLELLEALADARPDWSIVMIGPVVKIDPADLPTRPNLHFLGNKPYGDLPDYLRGWNVALMPFAINDATRFISPTKTPEYLAAGRPVVSTPIVDVVRHYGALTGVAIAPTAAEFVAACDAALERARCPAAWLPGVDAALAAMSWNNSHAVMSRMIAETMSNRRGVHPLAAADDLQDRESKHYDVMVVGAGFAGAVMAERLAANGKSVLVVDRRPHVAGNAYDRYDDAGVLIHQYGPHIFHTNSADVFGYLSRFTDWRPYEHRVLAQVGDALLPIPINRATLNGLYDLDLQSDADAERFLAARAEPVEPVRTSADVVISAVGRDLYKTFFEGYTRKQWGVDPTELDKSVTARVPTRTSLDDRYFTDRFQAMPLDGYTAMFERMLDHPNIDLLLGVDYREVKAALSYDHLVFTGPIDEYFGHCYGRLPYRSLRFQHETLDCEWHQPVAVVNYPDEAVPFTRVTEYKHLTGQQARRTSITREFPSAEGDPYYPVPRPENQALFKRYEALATAEPGVTFVGRLATYRYYNMDQVVGQALAASRRLIARLEQSEPSGLTETAPTRNQLVA